MLARAGHPHPPHLTSRLLALQALHRYNCTAWGLIPSGFERNPGLAECSALLTRGERAHLPCPVLS
jgi:phage tail protein X